MKATVLLFVAILLVSCSDLVSQRLPEKRINVTAEVISINPSSGYNPFMGKAYNMMAAKRCNIHLKTTDGGYLINLRSPSYFCRDLYLHQRVSVVKIIKVHGGEEKIYFSW